MPANPRQSIADRPLFAIGLMLLAVLVFSLMDVAIKLLVANYPPMQVTFLRCAGSVPLFAAAILISGDYSRFKTALPGLQLLRGVLGIVLLTSVGICFQELPLADAYALFFAAPLVISLLAGPLLGEPAGMHRLLAAVIGFAGVIVILKPGGSGLNLSLGTVMGLIAVLCYSLTSILMRHLGRRDSALTIAFHFTLIAGLGSGLLALAGWVPIHTDHWPVILLLVLSGTVAQIMMTVAFRLATPSVLAPFDYTSMIWALIFGYWIWSDVPGWHTLVGAAIVTLSGLYIIQRERQLKRGHDPASAAAGPHPPD